MCSKPYRAGGTIEFGCGKCNACRFNRSRLWTGRLLLESTQHPSSLFVTLTYSDDQLPVNSWLKPVDVQRFMKRLRKNHGKAIRFFAVGEYGEKTWRPHYHLALFGEFETRNDSMGNLLCDVVDSSWNKGHTHVGRLEQKSAAYLAGYITKHLTRLSDPELEGRTPEFARMSLRPGIGRLAIAKMQTGLMGRKGAAFLAAKGDVPTEFKMDGKTYSLGRYLTNGLRDEVGRSPGTPVPLQLQRSAERNAEDPKVRESVRMQHKNIAARRVKSQSKEKL